MIRGQDHECVLPKAHQELCHWLLADALPLGFHYQIHFVFKKYLFIFIYLTVPSLSSGGMWDLVP